MAYSFDQAAYAPIKEIIEYNVWPAKDVRFNFKRRQKRRQQYFVPSWSARPAVQVWFRREGNRYEVTSFQGF